MSYSHEIKPNICPLISCLRYGHLYVMVTYTTDYTTCIHSVHLLQT